ncbi:MAG: DNA replication/repair protein RecF [Rhodospirillaceae bacterium]|nr:DNA replication/repair protein RecF [Rhodospirillaceae bacterium]
MRGRNAVTRLVLTDFRCYERLRLTVDGRPVVLTGPNGAGKTNLLEALSLLAPGRGLRRARLDEIDRGGAAGPGNCWAVAATLDTADGPTEVGTAHEPAGDGAAEAGRGRRAVRIDGSAVRGQAPLAALATVAWLTPEMDRLFLEASSDRRRFLDRLVYGHQPGHATRIGAYEQAMRERNRLLRDRLGNRLGDDVWLDALEQRMAEESVAIAAARNEVVARLNGAMALAEGPFPRAGLTLDGLVEGWLAEGPALAAEERLRDALRAARSEDAAAGRTGAGPHRTDLAVRHLEKGRAAGECSTGEQKALLISIVLADARLVAMQSGATPILLLDEVVAHLDGRRRAALFDELCALGAQAWLTGTDRALFSGLEGRAQFFAVADAELRSEAA